MIKRILIADDEKALRQLLDLMLRGQGYEVLVAQNGDQLVRMAQDHVPDLVLVDLMMPNLDGYEAIRQLRNDTRTAHIPMLILTAKSTPTDVVTGFETGADDYIVKPFNITELLARIKSHLRRAAQRPVRNPLTDLPGNILLTEELKYRMRSSDPFALLYVDLDNFKAFNDTYGFARGDLMIKLVADVLVEVLQKYGSGHDFIGHIGGDDFAVLTSPDVVDGVCQHITQTFDRYVLSLYDPLDIDRGFLQSIDRQGVLRRFPITTISIGVVTNRQRTFADHDEISRIAAEMKQLAKQQLGSSYTIDGVSTPEHFRSEERPNGSTSIILLVSQDTNLLSMLRLVLMKESYRVLEATSLAGAQVLLTQEPGLMLVVGDARLGNDLWGLADSLRTPPYNVPLIILSTRAQDEEVGFKHGARAFIKQPFQLQLFLACVAEVVRQGG